MHIRFTTANGSQWVATVTQPQYGRPAPKGREVYAQHVGSEDAPAHLKGVVGFYAPTLDAVAAKLEG